jgi:hypothetical protein
MDNERPQYTEEEITAYHISILKSVYNMFEIMNAYRYLLRHVLVEGFFMETAGGDGYDRYEIKDGVYTHTSLTPPDEEWETILTLNIQNMGQVAHEIPYCDLWTIYRHRGVKEVIQTKT